MSYSGNGFSGGGAQGPPGPPGQQGPQGATGATGSSGGGGISGLTTGTIPVATSSSTLGDSILTQAGNLLSFIGNGLFGQANDPVASNNTVVIIGGGTNGGSSFLGGGESATQADNNVFIYGGAGGAGTVNISGCANFQAGAGTLNLSAGAMSSGIAGSITVGNGLDNLAINTATATFQPNTDSTGVLEVKKANGNVVMTVDTLTPAFSFNSNAGTPYFKIDGSAAGGLGAVFVDLSEAGGFFQVTNTSYGPSLYVDCGADTVATGNSAGGTNTQFACYNGDGRTGLLVDNVGRAVTVGNTTDSYPLQVQGSLSVQPNVDGVFATFNNALATPLLSIDSTGSGKLIPSCDIIPPTDASINIGNDTYRILQVRSNFLKANTTITNSIAALNASVVQLQHSMVDGNGSPTVYVGTSSSPFLGGYSTSWVSTSDRRIKKNIKTGHLGLDFINKVPTASYDLIYEKAKGRHHGILAQSLEQIISPEDFAGLKKPEQENEIYGIDYAQFVAPLIKAVQELSVRLNAQKKRNDLLEAKNVQLEQRLSRLENLNASARIVREVPQDMNRSIEVPRLASVEDDFDLVNSEEY